MSAARAHFGLRSLLLCAALAVASFAAPAAHAADPATPAITRVWAQWREAASFDRISEYFGRGEPTDGHRILRTNTGARAGFYFLVRLDYAAPADAKFELQIIAPEKPDAQTFTFPAATTASETIYDLGVTGPDWPGGANTRPVAWRLALLTADGRVLTEQKSFLWENPAK